jgi:hypothetical protein
MRFVSIDIETTGLDPNTCQVLEIGAVINDPGVGLEKLPTFRYRILRDNYAGEPYALSMHRDLFKDLANAKRNTNGGFSGELVSKDWYGFECEFSRKFDGWLRSWGIDPTKFVAAGKNFAGFDATFLKKMRQPGAPIIRWHHRILDPGSMYVRPDDEFVPDTNECCRRAGVHPNDIPGAWHTAIHDALVVVALIRNHWEQQ